MSITCETGRHKKAADFWFKLAVRFPLKILSLGHMVRHTPSLIPFLFSSSVLAFKGLSPLDLLFQSPSLFFQEPSVSSYTCAVEAIGQGCKSIPVLEARKSDASGPNAVCFACNRTSWATLWSSAQIIVSHAQAAITSSVTSLGEIAVAPPPQERSRKRRDVSVTTMPKNKGNVRPTALGADLRPGPVTILPFQ